ncbi:hypothetical protein FFR93_40200 [Rhizobium sp. MHM7A]|nr:hypothetical protein FFR93_40200 [Rhizobium sp. MHM7A]
MTTPLKHLTGHGPTEGLGSTELLHIYLSNQLDDHRIGAAGARVPGYEIRLVTPDGEPGRWCMDRDLSGSGSVMGLSMWSVHCGGWI